MNWIKCFIVGILVLFASPAVAGIVEKTVEYKQGSTLLEGFLAYPDHLKGKHSAVIVVHEWNGLGDYVKSRVRQLAELGYVAFGADIYGKGVRPVGPSACMAESGKYKNDRKLLRARAKAALDYVRKYPLVDSKRISAIGYCFGGTVVLEMARAGMPLAGVVSFHGGLDTPNPAKKGDIKTRVLVLHGADDPFTSDDQIISFWKEMRQSGADWQFHSYSGAQHSFTNPESKGTLKGVLFNPTADRRSWQAMLGFFKEIFGEK